ncbi:MAG: DUF4332 domain-containing protein [Anaerolineaceae bacterium]|nr:DUF4332 domain-containing protein [Anaerolineaceae bacterium]
MSEPTFEQFLRKRGKKAHVVAELTAQVRQFKAYLAEEKELATAVPQDLLDYADELDTRQPGSSGKSVRGLILYYHFTGQTDLAETAHHIREQMTAKTRRIFPLKEFRGVDPDCLAKLASRGIVDVQQMLANGATPEARQQLAAVTAVPPQTILELVKLSDLSRLSGLKGIRARLYYDAGADTVAKIAAWEPEALRQMLADFVTRTGFDGIAPLPKEVQSVVHSARSLPEVVQYN